MSLRTVAVGQSPYAVLNALIAALRPSGVLGKDDVGTSGLTLALYGGCVNVGGVLTELADQTSIALTGSATNYIEFDPTGTGTTSGIRVNTSGFTAGRVPLYTLVCSSTAITSATDHRTHVPSLPLQTVNMASDANKTLTAAEQNSDVIKITSTTLTATRNVVIGLVPRARFIINATTGGQSIQVIGATGTGITIATSKTACVMPDGTNVLRLTADA